jgi:CPA2 family monovalent cation:H+ antiporter-2
VEALLFQFAALVGVLGLAAIASLALRLPAVPLYIAAGLFLGERMGDPDLARFMGSLGVVFLLFSLGLEFSVGSLAQAPGRFLRAGMLDLLFNFPAGLVVGALLGWSWLESLFLAGILYMSSSAVVAKCVIEFGRAARPETETLLGIMVFEDLVVAGLLVGLGAFASAGAAQDPSEAVAVLARAVFFVGLLLVLAWRYHGPIEALLRARSEESFTLVLVAFVLLVASAALASGLPEALGGFLAGLVVGATELKGRASQTLLPFQTLFAALFFVTFGMSLDLGRVTEVGGTALALVALGILTKLSGGILAGRSAGHSPRLSIVLGLSLIPKGEFSIVLAALAASVASPETRIDALTGVYVLALSILGPIGMREADRIAALASRLFPRRAAR